ncbi:MAG TPA: ABC transporter substrate-binding protein [Bradyrhizobium sp.]|uniref:ABC transporter substrate-binding protein n=1 Tax=Bradyrhizobium sp. TaxID=376 RepID=UPI002B482DB3|nr:ABC transporter substrate-binding protein [Bradyrhizobium sp.]HKO69853.1 ABC transporter substrate-binding protein [Bradyrhizobium sp.]
MLGQSRRVFITLLGSAAAARPLGAWAQEPGRIYRIGSLHQAPRNAAHHVAFFAVLEQNGFVEDRNLVVDRRGYGMSAEQFAGLAKQHVDDHVDLILCGGDAAGRAAQAASRTIPVVVLADDMVRAGLVSSLQKPGGNITGVSIFAAELNGKRLELLIEAVPSARRIAILSDPESTTAVQLQALQDVAKSHDVELLIHQAGKREAIVSALDAAKATGATALNVLASALFFNNRQSIFRQVAALRLPAMYQWPEMAEAEGLLAYGPRIIQIYRDIIARQVVAVMRGTKPAELPVEQPTRFDLVVNLKAAGAIGLELPAGLVLRADRLIE